MGTCSSSHHVHWRNSDVGIVVATLETKGIDAIMRACHMPSRAIFQGEIFQRDFPKVESYLYVPCPLDIRHRPFVSPTLPTAVT